MRKLLPYFTLCVLVLILAVKNYSLSTWLTGWDNLHPEFNFPLNIQRSIFSVWQEYQGLGSIGGLAYASDLIRQLILWVFSIVLPGSVLRYLFTFFMLLVGPLGLYTLLYKIVFNALEKKEKKVVSFLGGVFYLLNLATIQIFYTVFDPFVAFYGFLPWMVFSFFYYLKKPTKKSLVFFLFINILATTQWYVTTIFVVFIISIFFLITGVFIQDRPINIIKNSIISLFIIFFINAFWLLPFSYFTFTHVDQPVESHMNNMSTEDIYFRNKQFGSLSDVARLKGFSFEYVDRDLNGNYSYLMDKWRDHIKNPFVLLIGYSSFLIIILGIFSAIKNKNKYTWAFFLLFLFSFTMLASDTTPFSYIVDILRNNIPMFAQIFRVSFTKFGNLALLSYSIFFAYGILAFLNIVKKKDKKQIIMPYISPIILICFIFYVLPVFQGDLFYRKLKLKIPNDYFELTTFLNNHTDGERIALLPQYTYWGWNYYSWGYGGSGFLWYGVENSTLDRAFDGYRRVNENYYWEISNAIYSDNVRLLLQLLEKYQIKWIVLDRNIIGASTVKTLYLDKIEQFLSYSDKIETIETFGMIKIYKVNLKTVSKDFIFIANDLPAVGPEYKWNNYDKAYEEYGNYITDNRQHLTDNREQSTIYYPTKKSAFADSGEFNVSGTSASQASSRVSRNNSIVKCVESGPEGNCTPELLLERQSPHYARPTQDQAYQEGDSIVNKVFAKDNSDSSTPEVSLPLIYYPFRSLFTGRQQGELEFGVEDRGNYFSFKSIIPKSLVGYKLILPKLYGKEVTEINTNDLSQSIEKVPQVYLDRELINTTSFWGAGATPESDSGPASPAGRQARMIEGAVDLPYIKEGNLEIRVPKINGYYSYNINPKSEIRNPKTCDEFNKGVYKHNLISEGSNNLLRLTSIGSSNCLDFDLPNLSHDIGYLITVENRNVEGKSLLFSVINKNSQRADIETYLPKLNSNSFTLPAQAGIGGAPSGHPRGVLTAYFVIPHMEQYGLGYSLHLDNISIGRVKTVNDLGKIAVNPIPYRFLTSLKIVKDTTLKGSTFKRGIKVDHPNPSLYQVIFDSSTIGGVPDSIGTTSEVSLSQSRNTTLILSQSFDEGWRAYQIKLKTQNSKLKTFLVQAFPFLFGKEIKDHVLVNNWENGWNLQLPTTNYQPSTIIIVYLPQYLEYFGFVLLGVAILIVFLYPKNKIHDNSASTEVSKIKAINRISN